jgi:nicotinamide mononucleotide transporter
MNSWSMKELSVGVFGAVLLTLVIYLAGNSIGLVSAYDYLWLEILGVITNFACVWLVARQNVWNWPIGVAAVVLLGVLFWFTGLYASMVLSLVYFLPIQFYGWYNWVYGGKDNTELGVSRLTVNQWLFLVGAAVPVWFVVSYINNSFGATLPVLDTGILVLSIIAQQLMTEKKIENWLFWIAVNVLSVVVYGSAGLYVLCAQYVFFLGNAVYGFYEWYRSKPVTM